MVRARTKLNSLVSVTWWIMVVLFVDMRKTERGKLSRSKILSIYN